MSNQTTITRPYSDSKESVMLAIITSLITKFMELSSVFIDAFASVVNRFKSKAADVKPFTNEEIDYNESPDENGFYSLFKDKELFKKAYGHTDNPLLM